MDAPYAAAWDAYEREMAMGDFCQSIAERCFPDTWDKHFKTPELGEWADYRKPFCAMNDDWEPELPEYVKLEDGTIVYHSIEDDYLKEYVLEVVQEQARDLFDYSWDSVDRDKFIEEIFEDEWDFVKNDCREFIRKKDAERGIIYDPDFLTKQNAA